ncbi:MAG: bifunctional riboflavin kinase/FAD synthetase [Bacteroidales bacterium]
MKIYTNIKDFTGGKFSVVTVGTFDGLHIGHKKIVNTMKEIAAANNGETILVTFDPHPRLVVNTNIANLKFINTNERKFKLLENLGIDHLIIIPFTKEFAKTSSEDFIKEYLIDKLDLKKLIVGYDHHFGKDREGNYDKLNELGRKYGFEVFEVPAQFIGNQAVSSTKIRNSLMNGNIREANAMLGYEYSISGHVVEGNKIGRSIGFPTANIEIDDKYKLISAGGVYACKVEIDGNLFPGMGNIGTRPTIGKHDFVTEVHIFNFNENIYGKEISVYFIERIRDEKKFKDLEELKNQLIRDKNTVAELFGAAYVKSQEFNTGILF